MLFRVQKNERRVVWSHHYKMTPVAFGPSDSVVLLKVAGNFQTRFTQTVKIPLSASFPVLTKCQWEKNVNTAFPGPTKTGPFGLGYLLYISNQ